MRLPLGNAVEQAVDLRGKSFRATVEARLKEKFNGYIALAIEGNYGIEEGSLIFRSGSVLGAAYEYSKQGVEVFGNDAAKACFNAAAAKYVAMDVYSLSQQQVDLALALNENARLNPAIGLNAVGRYFVQIFSPQLAERHLVKQLQEKALKESKASVLKKLGLSGIGG